MFKTLIFLTCKGTAIFRNDQKSEEKFISGLATLRK